MIKLKKIYEESVLKFTEKMNSDEKECFLSEVITYSTVNSTKIHTDNITKEKRTRKKTNKQFNFKD